MTKEMYKKVERLYNRAYNYIVNEAIDSPHDIINNTYDELCDMDDFRELCATCAYHINMWSADTLEEQICDSYDIVEEISGVLGEWLDNN